MDIKKEEEIYSDLETNFKQNTNKVTDFSVGSVIRAILKAVAATIFELWYFVSDAVKLAFISTTRDEYLDGKANDYGLTRKPSLYAKGTVTFFRLTPSNTVITIPKGSLVTRQYPTLLEYRTTQEAVINEYIESIDVPVECTVPGAIGNTISNTINLISSSIPGVDGVINKSPISGGVEEESDDDLRVRVLNTFKGAKVGTNTWYEELAKSVPGVFSAKVVGNRGPGSVDIVILGYGNTLPTTELLAAVQAVIDENKILGVDAKVFSPPAKMITITAVIEVFTGIDKPSVINLATSAISDFIYNLGIGAESIEGVITISKLTSIILSIDGVKDTTVSGSNITINANELPVVQTITIT